MRFKYLDLPEVPVELLTDINTISKLKNVFKLKLYPFYKQYEVPNQELKDYIEELFKCRCFCSYQIIRNKIAIHKDMGRTECYNYIIDPGGQNAALDLYDESLVLVESIKIPSYKWHWIDVSQFHGVSNIETIRLSLSIVKLKNEPI
jgi:hypothetical protein